MNFSRRITAKPMPGQRRNAKPHHSIPSFGRPVVPDPAGQALRADLAGGERKDMAAAASASGTTACSTNVLRPFPWACTCPGAVSHRWLTSAEGDFGADGLCFFPSLIDHKVETRGEQPRMFGRTHQQLAAEEAVGTVLRLARKIELGGQHAAAARLHLHMDMPRASDIGAGHDGSQPKAPVGFGELMAAQAE